MLDRVDAFDERLARLDRQRFLPDHLAGVETLVDVVHGDTGRLDSGRECVYEPAAVATHLEKAFRDRPTRQAQEMAERSIAHLWAKHAATDLSPWVPPVR